MRDPLGRRDVLKRAALLGLVVPASLAIPKVAEAGKGWCRMDPWAEFDGQLVEFYGDAYTETDFSTIVPGSAIFTVYRPSSGIHTFVLTETPDCVVNYTDTPLWGQATKWVIKFEFMTTNGDNQGRIQTIIHEPGPISNKIVTFSNYSGIATF